MRKPLFPLTWLALLGLPLAAPAQQAPADSARPFRRALALTASPQLDHFFTANRALPLGLLYRWPAAPAATWRVRLGTQYRYDRATDPPKITTAYTESDLHLEAALGREWWRRLGSRSSAYAGVEVGAVGGVFHRHSFQSLTSQPIPDPLDPNARARLTRERDERRTEVGAFVQPLVGLRYGLGRRLFVEAEATFDLRWTRTSYRLTGPADYDAYTGQVYANAPLPIDNRETLRAVRGQFSPVRRVQLGFLF